MTLEAAVTYDLWTWPGWSAVGAWASILALATVAAAAWQFLRRRRQALAFRLGWVVLGTASIAGDEYHVVEFRNAGSGVGHLDLLMIVNGHVLLKDEFRAPLLVGEDSRSSC